MAELPVRWGRIGLTRTLIHPSAWKWNSRKSKSSILHAAGPIGPAAVQERVTSRPTGAYQAVTCINLRRGEWPVVTSRRGYSCRKRGDAGWLVVSGKAEAEVGRQARVGRQAQAGGHAPLLRSPPSAPPSATSGRPLLPRRNVAGAQSERPLLKSFTKRSGDRGYPPKMLRHQHRGSGLS